ncbi:MAG: 3'(2'),5'-bisphosphate nucleotidase CysQ [Candidatus Methylumidiphilus sp.]
MRAPSRFLSAAVALAALAGDQMLRVYQSRFRIDRLPDGSSFTAADLISHHYLTESLPCLQGGYPVLSGLSALPPLAERGGWETYWLVDTLGGSGEFVRHSDEFTVNIALIHQHQPVLGVVYAPALRTCYFAAEGCGAFKQTGDGEPHEICVRMRAQEQPLVAGEHSGSLSIYLGQLGEHRFSRHSNAWALCQVAEGSADVCPSLTPSQQWETAAGQCIVEAAGGALTDLQGRALRYNARASLSNPYCLAYGDKTRDWRAPAATIKEPPMPRDFLPSPLLQAALALAVKAGGKIMDIYHSDFRVAHKEDDSPLTAADLAAHHCLSEGLALLPGAYPVLSEEAAALPFEERSAWDSYWLIDPLDGTKEFVKRNGEFTVNIALIRDHRPVLGVVYAPALGVCYFAEQDGGAFKQTGSAEPQPIAVRKPAAEPLTVVGSRSHATPELALYLDRLGGHELKPIGSSLKFCLIAEGVADLYPRIGPTCEWDTAAAQCVVEVAGGAVTDLSGEPLRYNGKASLLNPYFLVFGDNSRDWASYAKGLELGPEQAGRLAA